MQTECACSLEAAVLNAGAHSSQSRWKFSRGYKGMHGFKRVSLVSFPLCVCIYMCVYMYVYINVYIHAAAAAKLLQLCLTLCDPIDGSSPGSSVPGTLQARTLEWIALSFSKAWKWKVKVKLLSCVWLLVTPWTVAHQAPLSMGFSRQEYWSGVPLPSPIVMLVL